MRAVVKITPSNILARHIQSVCARCSFRIRRACILPWRLRNLSGITRVSSRTHLSTPSEVPSRIPTWVFSGIPTKLSSSFSTAVTIWFLIQFFLRSSRDFKRSHFWNSSLRGSTFLKILLLRFFQELLLVFLLRFFLEFFWDFSKSFLLYSLKDCFFVGFILWKIPPSYILPGVSFKIPSNVSSCILLRAFLGIISVDPSGIPPGVIFMTSPRIPSVIHAAIPFRISPGVY